MGKIHADPVADGRPTPSRVAYLLAAIMIVAGSIRIWQGAPLDGIGDVAFGVCFILWEKTRVASWENGYLTGFGSALRQVEREVEDDDAPDA